MDRVLAMNIDDRARLFAQAAAEFGLPLATIAKDFWVCLMLRELFTLPEISSHLTFKGGTSLSKAWGLIDRFSEDVDLTIDHELLGISAAQEPSGVMSPTQQKKRLDAIKAAAQTMVQQRIATELTGRVAALLGPGGWAIDVGGEDPDEQTLLFSYPDAPGSNVGGYLRPWVKLEFGARGAPWPAEQRSIRAMAAETFPDLFTAPDVRVNALRPERTFWEKVMLLHEEQHRPDQRPVGRAMARHYYDVWRLIEAGTASAAAADTDLFEQVAIHRALYFRHTWMDYSTLRRGSIQMLPTATQVDDWHNDYVAMLPAMFVSDQPPFEEILAVIEQFQSEFNGA